MTHKCNLKAASVVVEDICDSECENGSYVHIKFDHIFEFQN